MIGLSAKQLQIINFPAMVNAKGEPYDALVCDGSIRSGKTTFMTISFITDGMERYSGRRFAICGRTVGSAKKNIVKPLQADKTLEFLGYRTKYNLTDNELIVTKGSRTNVFEIFGGKDEASYTLIQGRTLAGVLFDEVALQPRSFVEQALARCSVDGSRYWFNCNPENSLHWFKTDWIDKLEEHNALHLHFTLDDNPSLSEKVKARYRSNYSGVFYQRYILGLWVMAEGLIYDMFSNERHILDVIPDVSGDYYIASDFGIQNATTFLLFQKETGSSRWIETNEYYYSGREEKLQKTVDELIEGLETILLRDEDGDIIKPKAIIVDPSAAALITALRKRGYHVRPADNEVKAGIADVSTLLKQDKIAVSRRCENTIKEFSVYAWDKKARDRGEDAPVKENDHCMDAFRYFVKTLKLVNRMEEKRYTSVFQRRI